MNLRRKYQKGFEQWVCTDMEENTNGVAPANGVLILLQIGLECVCISGLDDFHSHPIQGLNGLVNRTLLFVVICVAEPDKGNVLR